VPEGVSVTGIGVVSALGVARDELRDRLIEGATGIAPAPAFAALGCRSTLAARVCGFDPARWIAPMKLRRMDATGPFALVAVQQAMEDAGYSARSDGDDGAGVVLGTFSAGGHATNEYLTALFRGGPSGAPALLFNSTVANAAAGLAGLEYRLRGPNLTISQKEASGLAAIATAVDLLRDERADALAAGGMDAIYDIFFQAHDRFRVMSDAAEAGSSHAPFSSNRRGFVMGEGGFALWLERGQGWRDRGARRYGEIIGVGAASAAVPLNQWPDRPEPLIRTMELALRDAGLAPHDVEVVYASANATQLLDVVEAQALTSLFGGSDTVITSTKGALGEFGASGSAACAAALLCGAARTAPPIARLTDADQAARPLRLATVATPIAGGVAMVNSFASGGALVTLILRVHP
jgi:3-oxoacyl-[acyl-carrier-protein] synthase II